MVLVAKNHQNLKKIQRSILKQITGCPGTPCIAVDEAHDDCVLLDDYLRLKDE